MTEKPTVTLEEADKKQLLEFFNKQDNKMLASVAKAISMMVRAFDGKSIEPEDIISRFTNIKNILERSRFPTYPLLAKQVYLRLIKEYNPQAAACERWANLEAEALISYKGLSREEYVDSIKAAASVPEQQFHIGDRSMQQPQKRRFWQRKPKEQSEFISQ